MAGNTKNGESDRGGLRDRQDAVLDDEEGLNEKFDPYEPSSDTDITWSEELLKLREARRKAVEKAREVATSMETYISERPAKYGG